MSSRTTRPATERAHRLDLFRATGWIGVLVVWLFVLASIAGFDPADPPTHTVWPPNDPVRNLCGPVGAFIAYHLLRHFGVGVWVLLFSGGAYLAVTASGRQVGLVWVRSIGVLILAAGVSAMQGLWAPASGSFPGLAGGLIGSFAAAEFAARFNTFGASLWVIAMALVGAVVAFDRWVVLAPLWAWGRTAPVAARVGSAATARARRGPGLVAGLRTMMRGRKPVGIRLNDLDDDEAIPDAERELDPSDATRAGKKRVRVTPVQAPIADEPASEGPEEEEQREFTPEELREKIARLPVIFAKDTRMVATEDDMRDLQDLSSMGEYKFPPLDLLEDPEENFNERLEQIVRDQATVLERALREYRIRGEVVGIESGPVVTLYDVRLAPGTKVSALTAVASDIARQLRAINVRIVQNQAGRDTVGVEVPNPTKERVRLKELMSKGGKSEQMRLPMFLGKDASGEPLVADLTRMPHMLIAGTTGSGKSVCINTIITGFLYTKTPAELRLVLVDPKMVEMSQFKDIPHLMCPVVTEMSRAAAILEWAVRKMDERYELLAEAGCRDITAYNEMTWEELKERFHPESPEEEARIPRKLPYMVFIIDELADLMMTTKEVEGSIIRIAQKARAVGIHLILATQRPQANVVTGLIKSNMPCRVAFKVSSGMDSRIVLDQKGGELLLGQGDMLYLSPHTHKLVRAQGTLVDDHEIRRVVKFLREVARPSFERQLMQLRTGDLDTDRLLESENNSSASLAAAQEDPLFERAVEIVLETQRGSVSLLQRRLAIGYTRASRLIDLMGIAGIIGDHKGSVAREVMITPEEWQAMKAQAAADAAAGRLPAQHGQGDLFASAGAQPAALQVEEDAGHTTSDEWGDDDEEDAFDDDAEDEAGDEEDDDEEGWDEGDDKDWEDEDDAEDER